MQREKEGSTLGRCERLPDPEMERKGTLDSPAMAFGLRLGSELLLRHLV